MCLYRFIRRKLEGISCGESVLVELCLFVDLILGVDVEGDLMRWMLLQSRWELGLLCLFPTLPCKTLFYRKASVVVIKSRSPSKPDARRTSKASGMRSFDV